MSNLKNLLLRIKTVKSTQKITKVMKMISASKLKAAQRDVLSSNIFEQATFNNISRLHPTELPSELKSTLNDEELIIVITSNRGLCGSYNYHMIKMFLNYVKDKKKYKVFFIGSKGYDILYKQYSSHVIGFIKSDKLSFSKVKLVLDELLEKNFNTGIVFYTHFKNSFSLIPKKETIIPFIAQDECLANTQNKIEYKTEPDKTSLMAVMLKQYAYAHLYRMVKDSVASEHMSRMIAMDNATNNAGEVMDSLNILYNRSRQAKVTNELIEIISGMEAL